MLLRELLLKSAVANIVNPELESQLAAAPAASKAPITPARAPARRPRASRKRQPLVESEQVANIAKPPPTRKRRVSRKRQPAVALRPESEPESDEYDPIRQLPGNHTRIHRQNINSSRRCFFCRWQALKSKVIIHQTAWECSICGPDFPLCAVCFEPVHQHVSGESHHR
jgi:hypothetical protein